MASVAAVAADEARSPIENDLGEDRGLPGEITSGVYPKDEDIPGVNGDAEDSDEDLPANPLRGHRPARPTNDDEDEDDAENGGLDLFGDEEAEAAEEAEKPARRLDDEELDSGDDVDRTDRFGDEPEEEEERQYVQQERVTMDLELPRQPIPEPSDGEMYLLKMPSFISIQPKSFDIPAFQPPTTDHHSFRAPSATFSAYNTALGTIRWRHSPSDHSKLQSNARINRWADGSLTLQLASDPTTQYEIDGNPLAPPQRNPVKPTPVSIQTQTNRVGGRAGASAAGQDEKFNSAKDAFTYLVRPHLETGTMIVTHKVTAGLSIKQSDNVEDDAIERLQASLAAASGAGKVNGAHGLLMELDEKDPEEAKRNALLAQKKIEAERRKRQAQDERQQDRGRVGRAGMSNTRYSGLNVGMLEDDEDGTGQHRSPNKNRGAKPRRRRNSEYSDDEDFGRRNFQNDEYDRDDDFLAASDEEEVIEDDDDPDDGIVESPRHGHRERTPKRDRAAAEADDEEDAPGEEDEEELSHAARTKRRRVVDDEDEDE